MKIEKKLIHLKSIFLLLIFTVHIKSEETAISLNDISTEITADNYEIKSKVLTLTKNGDYKISGTCSECQIGIKKETEVNLTIDSITIDNSNTGPFVIKKNAVLNLILNGESIITDKEPIENESSTDETILDLFEGAGIKIKSSASLTISGTGTLTINGNTKNGIKGAANSKLFINSGNIIITAAKNALACDNILTINGGNIKITSESDGIKAEPDSDDLESKGTIEINGGEISIESQSDAIQAGYTLIINGGTFNIKTYKGSSATDFDKDTMSAKGLKCSTNEHENIENNLKITGGNFIFDTSDDAIHSDYNVTITGGTFDISSGDDAIHADQFLVLGVLNANNNLINIDIKKSYEGLEGSNIYIYSGKYNIISSDDGINSAGDTDENCNNQNGMGPGQGGPGGPNGPGGGRMPMNLRYRNLQNQCNNFHMFIYGGEIYVNSESDGLDANGNINIFGGNLEIWGMSSGGDGDPIDKDGTLTITGGTILAGGSQGMEPIHKSENTISQNFIYSTSSFNANKEINIKDGDNVIRKITIPKRINYLFYTSKETGSSYSFSDGNTIFKSGAKAQSDNFSFYLSSLNILFYFLLLVIY